MPEGPDIQQALLDFDATLKAKPNLTDEELFQKFPEFGGDVAKLQSAKDYSATLNSGKYKGVEEFNSKFPEFFGEVKKKDTPELGTSDGSESQSSGKISTKLQGAGAGVGKTNYRTESLDEVTEVVETPEVKTEKPVLTQVGDTFYTQDEVKEVESAKEQSKYLDQKIAQSESNPENVITAAISGKEGGLVALAREEKRAVDDKLYALEIQAKARDTENFNLFYDAATLKPVAIPNTKKDMDAALSDFYDKNFQWREDYVTKQRSTEFQGKTFEELEPDQQAVVRTAFSEQYKTPEQLQKMLKDEGIDYDLRKTPNLVNNFTKGVISTTGSIIEGADPSKMAIPDVLNNLIVKAGSNMITKSEYDRALENQKQAILSKVAYGLFNSEEKLPNIVPLGEGIDPQTGRNRYSYSEKQIQDYLAQMPEYEKADANNSPYRYEKGQLGDVADKVNDYANTIKTNPIYKENLGVKVVSGLGSTVPFIVSTVASRGLNLPSSLMTAMTGGFANASQTYNQAIQGGATPDQANKAYWVGMGIGATEAIPLERLMDKFGAGQSIRQKVVSTLAQGTTESIQETFSSLSNDALAKFLYDASQEIGETVNSDSGVGFLTGIIMSGGKILSTREGVTEEQQKMADDATERLKKYIVERGETAAKKEVEIKSDEKEVKTPIIEDETTENIEEIATDQNLVEEPTQNEPILEEKTVENTVAVEEVTSPEIDEKQTEIDAQIAEKKQKLAEAKAKREVKAEPVVEEVAVEPVKEEPKEEIISPKTETNVKDETKTETQEADLQEVKTGISETISKYGWTVEPQGKDQVLRNANGKIVATVKIKGEKYQIIGNDGAKLMSGNKNVAEAVEKVATKYFMAKERVEDVKEEVVEPVKEVEVTDGKNNTEAHKQLNDFITKELEHEPNTNNIQDLPIGVENWTDKELKRFPITEAYLKFKKKYGVSPKIERTQQSKEETQPEVKEETKVEKDTGLIDGINNIRSNDGAFNLFKVAFDRGVIHESLYNDFGLELAELKKDKKGKVDTSSVAEIILKYSEKEAKKKDDSVAREEQAKINKEYEESPTDKSLDDKIAAKKADLKARKANRNNLGILSNQNENEAEILALYTDLAGLYIAKGIKSAVDFAKELGEEISDIIKEAWDKANNVEEGIPTEVETVEKEVETVENTGNSITEEEEPEEKKKALLNRGHKGAIEVDDTELAEKIEEHGLTYEPESWAEGRRKAQELIKDIGIDDAIDIVRRGHVDGAAAAFVWAEAIDAVHNQIITETDPEQIELLQQREADLLSEFDKKARDKGRFISALQDIYANSDFQYDVEQTIKEIKDKNGGKIDPKDEARIRELGEQLEAKNKEYQEAVKRAEQAEYERDVANIAESVARQGKVGMSEQEVAEAIERGVQSEFDKIMARLPAQRKKTAKKTIEALEKMDKSLSGMNFDATLGIPVAIVRGGIKTIIAAIKLTGKVADSIEAGLKHIQEEYEKQFGKKLPAAEYGRVKTFIRENLEDAGIDTSSRKDKTVKEKGGKLKIPHELIREFVESGITDPNELTQEVLKEVQKQFPEATERQVRDAISQYGRTVNLNQEEIEVEIRRLKRAQRIISALEDIANKKRPLRSGLQRDVPTSEERALQKQLKEALKTLPPDLALQEKQLKTSLDAIQKRLENQIEDLEREIETGEKAVKENRELPYTDKIKELIAERDRVKEIHEEMFGKPELTDEQRLERAIKAIDRATSKVEERIRKGELTTEPGKVLTSTEKEAAKQRLRDAQEKLKELQELAGIPEQKRLEQAKKTATRRIADLQNKIAAGDFAKKVRKPLLADSELNQIVAEKRKLQEEFDRLKYKYELANRSRMTKFIDGLLEAWGITRALRATAEFSFMLLQGGFFAVSHPITAVKGFTNAWSHFLSTRRSENFANKIKSQSWYQGAREDKLAITESDYKLNAKEELFLNGWVNHIWDMIGLPIKLVSQKAFDRWKLANLPKAFERANVGAMNTIRITRYLQGVEMLQAQGKTRETHPQDYKNVANMVNTFTGRASLGGLENSKAMSKALTAVFFSPKMWASTFKTFTPYALWHFGKMTSAEFGNTGNLGRDKKTGKRQVSVAQKMAMADYMKFVGLTSAVVMAVAIKFNNDDDEETSVELDLRSSDALKIKIGDTRIDPWGGRIQMIVLQARILAETMNRMTREEGLATKLGWEDIPSYKRTSSGELLRLGEGYTDTMGGLLTTMTKNKLAPSAALVNKWLFAKLDSEGNTVDKFGNDYEPSDELVNSLYPIYAETIKELYEDQPVTVASFLTFYGFLGGGVQTYESKPKESGLKPLKKLKPKELKPLKQL